MAYSSAGNTNPLFAWLTRLVLFLVAALALMAGIVLAALFFALFLVLALIGGGWLWWQRRRLRRQGKQQADFIETEYVVLEQHRSRGTDPDREMR